MRNRWMGVGLISAGVVLSVALAGLRPEPVASAQAQAGWQCRSWTLELPIAGRYTLVACKP